MFFFLARLQGLFGIRKFTRSSASNNLLQNISVTQSGTIGYGIEIGDDNVTNGAGSNDNIVDEVTIRGTSGSGSIHGVLFGGNYGMCFKK